MSNTSKGEAPSVIAAEAHDADRVFGVLTLAFAADPPNRWMYPEPVEYLRYFPEFCSGIGRRCSTFRNGFCEPRLLCRRLVAGPWRESR